MQRHLSIYLCMDPKELLEIVEKTYKWPTGSGPETLHPRREHKRGDDVWISREILTSGLDDTVELRQPTSKMMGGQATTILPIMWVLVGIVFVFMGLRMYTRTHVLDQLGMDDHVYNLSGVSGTPPPFFLPLVLPAGLPFPKELTVPHEGGGQTTRSSCSSTLSSCRSRQSTALARTLPS